MESTQVLNGADGPAVAAVPRERPVCGTFLNCSDAAAMAALRDRGFDFDGAYSLLDLARLAVGAGGWDYLLSGTFWLFIVLCPAARGVTLLALLLCPLRRRGAMALHRASRALSYFYAHEVMIVGVPLLQITIGPLTKTLFTERLTPPCKPLDALYHEDICFQIAVLPDVGYYFLIASVCVYLLVGFDGSPTHKYVHRQLFPNDEPPPQLPRCLQQRQSSS